MHELSIIKKFSKFRYSTNHSAIIGSAKFGLCLSLFFLVVPAAKADLFDAIGNVLEDIVHKPGDWIEDVTHIDMDWADDANHLLEELFDSPCDQFKLADNCTAGAGVSVSTDGDATLLDGNGSPAAKPINQIEDSLPEYYTRVKAINLESDLAMQLAQAAQLKGRYPAGELLFYPEPELSDLPLYFERVNVGDISTGIGVAVHPTPTTSVASAASLVGLATNAATYYFGIRSAIQLNNELHAASWKLPAGQAFQFYAIYEGPVLRFIYPKGAPTVHKDTPTYRTLGPFSVVGQNTMQAEQGGASCTDTPAGSICVYGTNMVMNLSAGQYTLAKPNIPKPNVPKPPPREGKGCKYDNVLDCRYFIEP